MIMASENGEEKSEPKNIKRGKQTITGFEQWGGYMASKKQKLSNQFNEQKNFELEGKEHDTTEIFKGIAIFVNGYTRPSAEELKRLMLIHGGTYHYYYSSSKTTHIIATNLPDSKIKQLKTEIVVTPDWITDSIKAGKVLPHQNYLLYTPEILHKQHTLTGKYINIATKDYNKEDWIRNSKSPLQLHINKNDRNETVGERLYSANAIKNLHSQTDSCVTKSSSSFKNNMPGNCASKTESNVQMKCGSMNSTCETSNSNMQVKTISPWDSVGEPSESNVQMNRSKMAVKAGHPEFLSEFYSHSRLHHISNAGQELKRYVQHLVDNHKGKGFPAREKLRKFLKVSDISPLKMTHFDPSGKNSSRRNEAIIMHLDMDCFFVSVGLRKYPELRGHPVAVTHSKGKRGGAQEGSDIHYEATYYMNQSKKKIQGLTSTEEGISDDTSQDMQKILKYSKEYGSLSEIASCSYEARKAGVRNGMFLGEALRRCPNLKTIPYDFDGYSEVSKQLYDIVASYTLDIEAVSCDELYIDCSELLQCTKIPPLQFASILRAEIVEKTGCTASAGLGSNMLLARLANKIAKPNGQYFVPKTEIEEFMLKQKIGDLPGVGYSTSQRLEHFGVETCGDLQNWPLSKLQQEFGPRIGQALFNRCRGKDDRTVQLQKERKSVSAEINYGIRFETDEEVFKFINELSMEVHNRLQNINCKGRSLTLKLMIRKPDAPKETAKFMGHGVCDNVSKSILLKSATDNAILIGKECCYLARTLKIKPEDYRGVGIQMSKLEPLKDVKSTKTVESFLHQSHNSEENSLPKEIFAPKEFAVVDRTSSSGSTIKDFLMNKPSPSKPSHHKKQLHHEVNITPDQIDQSVLNALPKDLQKEVLETYQNYGLITDQSSSTNAVHSVNSKSHKPDFKKSSNLFQSTSKEICSTTTAKETSLFPEDNFYDSDQSDDSQDNVVKKKATLGGAEDLNDVRSLVKEWIQTSEVILDEDVEQFKDYLLDVMDEDLRKMDLVLKCFYRLTSSASERWKQTYLLVLSYVQQKMLQNHGFLLKAESEFPS